MGEGTSTASSPTPTIPETWPQDPAEVVPSSLLASRSNSCCSSSTLHGQYGARWCLHIAPHAHAWVGMTTRLYFLTNPVTDSKPGATTQSEHPKWPSWGGGRSASPCLLPLPALRCLPACSQACCCFLFWQQQATHRNANLL